MKSVKPTRHLRDAAELCLARFDVSGPPMRCELDAGHHGLHKYECTRWSDQHSMKPREA